METIFSINPSITVQLYQTKDLLLQRLIGGKIEVKEKGGNNV